MPRKSREKDNYGTYHIRQRGSGLTTLFADEDDRKEFLDIVLRTGEKNNFKVMAYCVSSDDQYDLILDANGCDISKVMKEINIRYSNHKKCEGCLFRDRFQSELLSSALPDGLGVDASTAFPEITDLKGCREFLRRIDELSVLDQQTYESMPSQLEQVYQRGCLERVQTIEAARARLDEELKELGMDMASLKKDKVLRNQLMIRMKACSTLSLKAIGQVFGGLTESSVSKILNAR